MKEFVNIFIKDTVSYLSTILYVILLFLFYYLIIPEYWFLCTLLTIIAFGALKILYFAKRKNKQK